MRDYEKEFERIRDLYIDLKEQNKKLRECLSFYADFENYGSEDKNRRTGNPVYDIILFDFDRNLNGNDYAGKRARQTLKEIDNEVKR